MPIVLIALVLGALVGFLRARKRGGNGFDKAQYAAVHAIIFGLVGLFITIFVLRAG
jgi:hypothetical protein